MMEPDSVWKACVAVHFENVGIQGIRLLAMKLHAMRPRGVQPSPQHNLR